MWAGLQKQIVLRLEQPTPGPGDQPVSAAALWGRAEVELGAAACSRDRLRPGLVGAGLEPRSPGTGGLPSSSVSVTTEPK